MNFPVYRKYTNGRSFFKIIHPLALEEIQVIGTRRLLHKLDAKLHPDRLFIADLLAPDGPAVPITEREYLVAAEGAIYSQK